MDGILPVFKPQGFTSFDVIAKLRGMAHQRRLGHAGTLDPMATGVLPVFFGIATKACDLLPDSDKEYVADFTLGQVTDTQDSTGEVLQTFPVAVSDTQIRDAVASFRGKQQQIPPMYSAIKVGGQKLCDLARRGVEIERRPREITLYEIELLAFDGIRGRLRISCSKGTYIRTVCHDLGQKLGCGAVMTALCRTKAAGFSLDDCLTLDEIQQYCDRGTLSSVLRPIGGVFSFLPRAVLSDALSRRFLNGVKLDAARLSLKTVGEEVGIWHENGQFLAIGTVAEESGRLVLRSKTQFFTLEDLNAHGDL